VLQSRAAVEVVLVVWVPMLALMLVQQAAQE
jgi:hypothetical protein